MEKTEIYKAAVKMKTVKDFAILLDHIKQDEFGTQKHKVTVQKLLHFSNAKIVPNRYKTMIATLANIL